MSHSSSYSFTKGLKVGFESGVSAIAAEFKITGELSISFTQAFTDGWSKSTGITLLSYTNVMIKQGDSTTTTTTKYNCPMIVGYKITITISQNNTLAQVLLQSTR